MKTKNEKNLSTKIFDISIKILDSHLIMLVSTLSHLGLIDWGFTVLVVAFILIVLARIFYKFDKPRRAALDSIIKRMVRSIVLGI